MVVRVTHAYVTGAPANPNALVDGPKFDADHVVTGAADLATDNLFLNATDITVPFPYVMSGTIQTPGGATFGGSLQVLGGKFYLGNGTNTTGYSGQVAIGIAAGTSGTAAGFALDVDSGVIQLMTLGTFSAVTNGLIGGLDFTPTWKSNKASGALFRFVKHITDLSVADALTINTDLTWSFNGSGLIGDATPAAGSAPRFAITGPTSGNNGGSFITGTIGFNGADSWAVGSVSALLGGAFDTTMLLRNDSAAYRFYNLTAGLLTSSANGTISVTALGSNVAAFLTTPSSANLRSAMTDESGTGALLFADGALGNATAATINKYTFTQPATAATLTILNNKTATFNNSITFAGTDSTAMTFPATTATIARTDAGQTFTGTQAFGAITATTINGATIDNNAWTAFTPTINSTGGTITTPGTCSGAYKLLGKICYFRAQISITTNGTGAGRIEMTIPPGQTPAASASLSGYNGNSFASIQPLISTGVSTTKIQVVTPSSAYPGADGWIGVITGFYETT